MSFNVRITGSNQSNSDRPNVDWAAMNAEVVEVAQLQQPETMVGIISGIYDVGIQPQDDAAIEWKGTPEQEAEEAAKNPNTYFEDMKDYQDGGKIKRYKRFPVKAAQSVVFAVDLPEVIVDKGKYFGSSDPKPLRLLLGGEFTPSGGKTIAARPFPLSIRKNDKTGNQWSIPFNNTIYKMALAAKLVTQGQPFLPDRIDELLGKAMQFKVQVFLNDGKYYTEKCAFAASLGRSQTAPAYDSSLLHIVQFDVDNEEAALKQLRASVKNTMRNASDFEGSKIQSQIGDAITPSKPEEKKPESVKQESTAPADNSEAGFDSFDDDIPFMRIMDSHVLCI